MLEDNENETSYWQVEEDVQDRGELKAFQFEPGMRHFQQSRRKATSSSTSTRSRLADKILRPCKDHLCHLYRTPSNVVLI